VFLEIGLIHKGCDAGSGELVQRGWFAVLAAGMS